MNVSIGYILFKKNYGFYIKVFYEKYIDFCLKSKVIDKFASKLKMLILIYKKSLYHA